MKGNLLLSSSGDLLIPERVIFVSTVVIGY